MKHIPPRVATVLVAVSLLPGADAGCWFGTVMCRDGTRHCLNPSNVVRCVFDAVSPITIDDILCAAGEQLGYVIDDSVDYTISLGDGAVNDVFNNAKACYKLLAGKETTCNELNGVKGCLNTALNLWPATKLQEGANLTADNLKKAEDAIDAIANKVIPALDQQCVNGCLGGLECGTTYDPPSASPSVTPVPADCFNASNKTTAAPSPTLAQEAPPVTLIYNPPVGCTCKNVTLTIQTKDSIAETIDKCARNAAFYMSETNLQFNKVYYNEMGCFVGKSPNDEASYSSCTQAALATEETVEFWDTDDWEQSDTQYHMFVACVDQFGRTYSQRNEPVPTPAPTPTTTRPLCKSPTPAPTPTATKTSVTSTKPSSAHSLNGDWSLTIIALYLGVLAASSLALLTQG